MIRVSLRKTLVVASCAAAVGLACGKSEESSPAAAPTPSQAPAAAPATAAGAPPSAAATAEAKQIFETRCTACHGAKGAGDGPASKGLTPPPRNFQDPQWQAAVKDDYIEQIVQYGGAAVGKSAAMPANPDLMAKPEVVTALRIYVRGLKSQ